MDIQSKLEINHPLDTNTLLSPEERLSLVRSLVFPESLENSKVISFLNEDFTFSLDELYNLKEVKKAYDSKEVLVKAIEEINFLKLDSLQNNCSIIINDEMAIYSLINVPAKISKEELIKLLGLQGKEQCFSRFYKKYFVWLLITELDSESQKIEESLKRAHFGEEKLKFDITLGKNLKKLILKRIHYNKDSYDLKANTKIEHNLGVSHPETCSWRKKSNDGEEMNSLKKAGKNELQSNTGNFKRKRFNSDGGIEESLTKNDAIFKNEKIVPSSEIKFRYSIKEMYDLYNLSQEYLSSYPRFSNLIKEVCRDQTRGYIHIFQELNNNKRDRSKTMHYQANDFIAFTQKQINLPKNNPLQDINNFDFNSNNTHHSNQTKNNNKSNHNHGNYKNKFDFAN